jgi:hypothetical protein
MAREKFSELQLRLVDRVCGDVLTPHGLSVGFPARSGTAGIGRTISRFLTKSFEKQS